MSSHVLDLSDGVVLRQVIPVRVGAESVLLMIKSAERMTYRRVNLDIVTVSRHRFRSYNHKISFFFGKQTLKTSVKVQDLFMKTKKLTE